MSDSAPQAAAPQGIPAVGFLVVAFTDENAADQALDCLLYTSRCV